MANELERAEIYYGRLRSKLQKIKWGKITLEMQNGVPVRIIEERSIKMDDEQADI